MPSVYLAKSNPGDAIPSFKQKGVPQLAPGIVGDVPIILHTEFYAVPQALYRYIYACIQTSSVITAKTLDYFSIFKPIVSLQRLFEVPPATFRFTNLTDPDRTELKGMGLQQDLTNGNLFVGTPATSFLGRLNQMGPDEDRARPGHINFEGYFAWVYLMKGVQIYTTAKNTLAKNGFNIMVNGAGTVNPGSSGHLNNLAGKATAYTNSEDMGIANYGGSFILLPPDAESKLEHFPGSFKDVASHDFNDDEMTGHKGIFFPCFSGMSLADKTTAYEVFIRLFQGSLAPDEVNDTKLLQRVRVGARQIAFSRAGLSLAHIYRCFEISMGICGAKVHIITKGSAYVGTVIEGDFSVSIYGTKYESGLIKPEIEKVNLLESQAQDVCDLINAVEDANDYRPYHFTKTDFLSSRAALSNFNSIDDSLFSSSGALDKVRDILESMEFNDTFPIPDQKLVAISVKFMATGDRSLLADYPAYLGSGVLANHSRTFEALSMYGPRVPTINVGGDKGTLFVFPAPGKTDTNLADSGNGKRSLQYIPVLGKPIGTAVVEWDRMISTGKFSILAPRKKKAEFTNLTDVIFSISQQPLFGEVYGHLKDMVQDARVLGNTTGKRKRGSSDGDKGGKKAKVGTEGDFI